MFGVAQCLGEGGGVGGGVGIWRLGLIVMATSNLVIVSCIVFKMFFWGKGV